MQACRNGAEFGPVHSVRARSAAVFRCGMVAVLSLLAGCAERAKSGRDWVLGGHAVALDLTITGKSTGKLHADKRLPDVVRKNYAAFLTNAACVYKDGQLFQRTPVPLEVYLIADAKTFAEFGGARLEPPGAFVAGDPPAIYLQLGPDPFSHHALQPRILRELACAVIHDMLGGTEQPWFLSGLSALLGDGAIDPVKERWVPGVPDPALWQALGDGKDLPSFQALSHAKADEFARLGARGRALACAVAYLLHTLDADALHTFTYQVQVRGARDADAVLSVLREFLPRAMDRLDQVLPSLYRLRPDLREFLACAGQPIGAKLLPRAKALAESNPEVGAYWWMFARCLAATKADPRAALERSAACPPHRDLGEVLRELTELLFRAKDWSALEKAVKQQLRASLAPTPRMCLMLAECLHATGKSPARIAADGLRLPAEGFETEVARLRELAAK